MRYFRNSFFITTKDGGFTFAETWGPEEKYPNRKELTDFVKKSDASYHDVIPISIQELSEEDYNQYNK